MDNQAEVLNFIGSLYGEAKKIDANIVGQSKDLTPMSEGLKQEFTKTLQSRNPVPQQSPATFNTPRNINPVAFQPPTGLPQQNSNVLQEISGKLDIIISLLHKKRKKKNVIKDTQVNTGEVS